MLTVRVFQGLRHVRRLRAREGPRQPRTCHQRGTARHLPPQTGVRPLQRGRAAPKRPQVQAAHVLQSEECRHARGQA